MKKLKKFKDDLTKHDSKRFDKKFLKQRKKKLKPAVNQHLKYRNIYLNLEEE